MTVLTVEELRAEQDLPTNANLGLRSVRSATLYELLGNPRQDYDQQCRGVELPALAERMVLRDVGKFRVRGLDVAVDALGELLEAISIDQPDVYPHIGSAGMLCARFIRGSTTSISRHSWGVAVDLTIGGRVDDYGDGRIQRGMALIIPIANRLGWYSGVTFGKEDSMHLEASDGLLRSWLGAELVPDDLLSLGDRGPEVVRLQQMLVAFGLPLLVDGRFDARTRQAVVSYQSMRALRVDGVAGPYTLTELRNESNWGER